MPICDKCDKEVDEVRRIVFYKEYDASKKKPLYLCPPCSVDKARELRERGHEIPLELLDA